LISGSRFATDSAFLHLGPSAGSRDLPTKGRTVMRSLLTRAAVAVTAIATVLAGSGLLPTEAEAADPHLSGVVRSPSGEPVANANVYASIGDDTSLYQRTGANGRFDFSGPFDSTTYTLCASIDQTDPQGGPAGWYRTCTTAAVGDTSVTLRLHVGSAISGVVTDLRTGGHPGGGWILVVQPDTGIEASGVVDAQGRWTVRNLEPRPRFETPNGVFVQSPFPASAPYGYAPAHPTGAVVTLRPGQVVSELTVEVVPLARFSGTVTSARGNSLSGANVTVRTTSSFGAFLNNRTWSVDAPWTGSADVCAFMRASDARPTGLELTCRSGSAPALTVTRDISLTRVGAAAQGEVVTPRGGPVPGIVEVSVAVPLPSGGSIDVAAFPFDGGYRVAGLPPGTYRVRAQATQGNGVTAVGWSAPVKVTRGAVATFSTITLSTG
jgi:hypothetical protein